MDKNIYKQILGIFQGELEERIQKITEHLLELEKNPRDLSAASKIDSIFREAHNIKGSAYSISLNDIGDLAHCLEDLFSEFRQGILLPTPDICALCFKALDSMSVMMQNISKELPADSDVEDVKKSLRETLVSLRTESTPETNNHEPKAPVIEVEKSSKKPIPNMEYIRVTLDKLSDINIISDEALGIRIKNNELLEQVKSLNGKMKSIVEACYVQIAILKSKFDLVEHEEFQNQNMNIIGQMRTMSEMINTMYYDMRNSTIDLGYLVQKLQDNVRSLRLVPIGSVLRPLFRTVHDISHELKKEVDIELIGEEIKVDRVILENIKSPIIHLIRNAIDHGIESTEDRIIKGKPEKGKLVVRVSEEGNQIHIGISDDGSGLDTEEILKTAINKKIIQASDKDKLSKEEIMNLITLPGFSTKKTITNVSGRGVGLDVVQTSMQMIKGALNIDSVPQLGTTITLQFPITLLTDRGMLVRVGEQFYIIPTVVIQRVVALDNQVVKQIEGTQALLLNNIPIPLISLAALLNISENLTEIENEGYAVVLYKGRVKVAFIVDEILGEREIAIKPLLPPLTKTPFIIGAALTGAGNVLLVLNPTDLIQAASKKRIFRERVPQTIKKDIQKILVVDDSFTTRTLEESILSSRGYNVLSAVNGVEAWNFLQKNPVDLVITDVEMPLMNGFELTNKIKQHESLKKIPVIIVTTHENDADKQRGIDVLADGYIVKKQFDTNALLDLIKQFL